MTRALLPLALLSAAAGEAPNLARVLPPAAKVSPEEAIRSGVAFLVTNQNADGSFGKSASANPYQLWCHVPGGHQAFRAATTALCWMGLNDVDHQPPESRKVQRRCLAWLVKHARVKRPFPEQFYNVWAFAYGLRALGQALRKEAPGATPAEIQNTMKAIVRELQIYQTPDGGWGYLDFNVPAYKPSWSTSFTTATVLVGLHEARSAGIEVPQAMIDRAVKMLRSQRTPYGNYRYSISHRYYPHSRINKAQGSSLRNQACNYALFLFDPERMDTAQLRRGLRQLVENHRFAVAAMRRPIPHESWYAVSGYFYLYGQQYASLILEAMPAADRKRFAPKVIEYVLKARQPDGSFWDYPTYGYHKFYGTGYALMALGRLAR